MLIITINRSTYLSFSGSILVWWHSTGPIWVLGFSSHTCGSLSRVNKQSQACLPSTAACCRFLPCAHHFVVFSSVLRVRRWSESIECRAKFSHLFLHAFITLPVLRSFSTAVPSQIAVAVLMPHCIATPASLELALLRSLVADFADRVILRPSPHPWPPSLLAAAIPCCNFGVSSWSLVGPTGHTIARIARGRLRSQRIAPLLSWLEGLQGCSLFLCD